MQSFRRVTKALLTQPNLPGLLGSTLALGAAFSFVVPFLSKWGTEEVGLTPTQFSLFMTLTTAASIVVGTTLARLSDTTYSRRKMLILGGSGGSLGFIGYALVRDPLILVLFGCSLHAVASICFAQLFAHTREYYLSIQRGGAANSMTMSVLRVVFSFAWTLGPAMGALILVSFGFKALFLSASGLWALFLLGVIRFVPEMPRQPLAEGQVHPGIWRSLRRPQLALCVLAFATLFAAQAINMLNLPLAFTRTLGGTDRHLGIVFGIGPVVEIPLMIWFGHLASRGYALGLIRFGFVITAAYFAGLWLASEPWHVYCLQILSGASFAILTNVAILYFQDLLPDQVGLSTAQFTNSQIFGSLCGMFSFGFLVEALGHQGCFLVCAILLAAASLLSLGFQKQRAQEPE